MAMAKAPWGQAGCWHVTFSLPRDGWKQWNTGVPPVLAGGHPDRCMLLPAGRQQPSTAGTAVFRSMNRRSHPEATPRGNWEVVQEELAESTSNVHAGACSYCRPGWRNW